MLSCVGLNLKDFPGGDQIEVLENAKNLSNSERRLMLLARSLYSSGDIYILVDFFGHDEPELEKKLYLSITNGLLKDKTVLVKSDNDHILSEAEMILRFQKGKMTQFESYTAYINSFARSQIAPKSVQPKKSEHWAKLKKKLGLKR